MLQGEITSGGPSLSRARQFAKCTSLLYSPRHSSRSIIDLISLIFVPFKGGDISGGQETRQGLVSIPLPPQRHLFLFKRAQKWRGSPAQSNHPSLDRPHPWVRHHWPEDNVTSTRCPVVTLLLTGLGFDPRPLPPSCCHVARGREKKRENQQRLDKINQRRTGKKKNETGMDKNRKKGPHYPPIAPPFLFSFLFSTSKFSTPR